MVGHNEAGFDKEVKLRISVVICIVCRALAVRG